MMPAGGYSLETSATATSPLSDRSPINIAPVGVNFGAILQPMNQGSPENGGYGMEFMRRYGGGSAGNLSAASVGGSNIMPYLLIGGAALVAALVFFVR